MLRLIAAVTCGLALLAGAGVTTVEPSPQDGAVHSFLRMEPAAATGSDDGLTPTDIASAYGLTGGSSGTVAIATAFSNPRLEADLAVYRARFGLPACTTASGCLRIVGQTGTAGRPGSDAGWGQETSLDVDAVSAACPDCSILVVEADSDQLSDLGEAVNTAARLGADAVSASWGNTEWSSWSSADREYFTHSGIPVVAATGDSGYDRAVFPAALPNVIAVGGTTLTATSGGSAAAMRTYEVHSGTVAVTPANATVDADKRALAKARTALSKAKRHVTAVKRHLHAVKVRLRHASSGPAKARWKHRMKTTTKSLAAARQAVTATAARVRKAESALVRDQLKASTGSSSTSTTGAGQTARSGWVETAWEGAGSGCSAFVPRPTWQPATTCSRRGIADISADADPQSGIATYDTFGTGEITDDGWLIAGGTSLAAPLVTAMLVRSGNASRYSSAQRLYANASGFWDITAGSNGGCSGPLCTAGTGYDGPTGLGSPKSLASF